MKHCCTVTLQVVEVGVLQSKSPQQVAKVSVGDKGDAVAAFLQTNPDADVRVNVAGRTIREEEKVHCGPRRPATRPAPILKSDQFTAVLVDFNVRLCWVPSAWQSHRESVP